MRGKVAASCFETQPTTCVSTTTGNTSERRIEQHFELRRWGDKSDSYGDSNGHSGYRRVTADGGCSPQNSTRLAQVRRAYSLKI